MTVKDYKKILDQYPDDSEVIIHIWDNTGGTYYIIHPPLNYPKVFVSHEKEKKGLYSSIGCADNCWAMTLNPRNLTLKES